MMHCVRLIPKPYREKRFCGCCWGSEDLWDPTHFLPLWSHPACCPANPGISAGFRSLCRLCCSRSPDHPSAAVRQWDPWDPSLSHLLVRFTVFINSIRLAATELEGTQLQNTQHHIVLHQLCFQYDALITKSTKLKHFSGVNFCFWID